MRLRLHGPKTGHAFGAGRDDVKNAFERITLLGQLDVSKRHLLIEFIEVDQ